MVDLLNASETLSSHRAFKAKAEERGADESVTRGIMGDMMDMFTGMFEMMMNFPVEFMEAMGEIMVRLAEIAEMLAPSE